MASFNVGEIFCHFYAIFPAENILQITLLQQDELFKLCCEAEYLGFKCLRLRKRSKNSNKFFLQSSYLYCFVWLSLKWTSASVGTGLCLEIAGAHAAARPLGGVLFFCPLLSCHSKWWAAAAGDAQKLLSSAITITLFNDGGVCVWHSPGKACSEDSVKWYTETLGQ